MAQPAAANDVLSKLDGQNPSAFYWQLTILATLGGFVFGYDTSNIGSALNFVPSTVAALPGKALKMIRAKMLMPVICWKTKKRHTTTSARRTPGVQAARRCCLFPPSTCSMTWAAERMSSSLTSPAASVAMALRTSS